ncbi:TPA: EAL domain-containing protein [Escherichia coli]|nr:EAL domain-containing protein [Escherichia coli]
MLFPVLIILSGVMVWCMTGRLTASQFQLWHAIRKKQFSPYLQPIVSGVSGKLTGAEVLVRWNHPQKGVLAPMNFIELAEKSGLIIPITRELMLQVSKYYSHQANKLPRDFYFAFNISACHFSDSSLIDDCRVFLKTFGMQRIKLVLEITEHELLVNNKVTAQVIRELHGLGVLIALDDFGTGYSTLSYLKDFPVDILKIEKQFISTINNNARSCHIIDNILDLSRRLNIVVVAEGIETEAQYDYLKKRNLHYLQGYLFGKPEGMDLFSHHWLNGRTH